MAEIAFGMPVEIGRIDKELKTLWQQGEGTNTRASMVNFAVYCEGREAMKHNTELIAEFTRDHACRALLIALDETAKERRSQAWISAHCHMSSGAKQVCCEQITFLLEGDSKALIPNIVFSHLDSDLPLYLWWQGDFTDGAEEQLWNWVDRLIIDSRLWRDPANQFEALQRSLKRAKQRLILCDLNWTRLLHWRQAMSRTFEHAENLEHLRKLTSVEITHDPGSRSTAALLGGWLISQMGWKLEHADQSLLHLFSEQPSGVDVSFKEASGPCISRVVLKSPEAEFRFCVECGSQYLHADIFLPGPCEYHHLLPAPLESVLDLLNQELVGGGPHSVYLRALSASKGLL